MKKIKIERPNRKKLSSMETEAWSPWECGVETFDWQYVQGTEKAYIQQGRAIVKTDWEEVEISKGDLVTFPKGLKCTWTVLEPIKKIYTFE